jgi:hypothetical protein
MSGNYGGNYLIRDVGSAGVYFHNCLLSGNYDLSAALVKAETYVSFEQCTIAANAIDGANVIENPGFVALFNTVIDQPGKRATSASGTSVYTKNVVATDTAGLDADPTVEQQQPLFLNAAEGDFRLLVARRDNGTIIASQGIDYAADGAAGDKDIDGRLRDRWILGWNGGGNLRDLGAFEMQLISDRLFASGFGDPVTIVY